MADIRRVLFMRHLRGTPTMHVRHVRGGRVVHEGTGQAFWFRPLTAVLSELPVDDRQLPLLFHARSLDYQDVTVQAAVTFRITDPALASSRLDFSIDPETGRWRSAPLEQIQGLLVELAQQHTLDALASLPLTEALTMGITLIRERIRAGLGSDQRLDDTGISVVGVRLIAIRPEPEVIRALESPARERMQQEADRAVYERRALAIEQERNLAESELRNQIDLAQCEKELVTRRGTVERLRVDTSASANRAEAEAKAEATRIMGEADAETERTRLEAYRDLDGAILLGLAVRELAGQLSHLRNGNLDPDAMNQVLGVLGGNRNALSHPESDGPR